MIPAQDDFYKLDNSQRLHVKKSLIKLENHGMLAGEALTVLSRLQEVKTQKLGLRMFFYETVNAMKLLKSLPLVREVITKFIQFLKTYKKQMNLFYNLIDCKNRPSNFGCIYNCFMF